MKQLLLAGVAIGALVLHGVATATAADLPRKAPVYAPSSLPVLSWTGCYAGGNVGWGWGKSDFSQVSSTFFPATASRSARTGIDTDGFVFGGQAGCDWQFAPNFVLGVQGMLNSADINGTAKDAMSPGSGATVGLSTNWIGSVTGRLGFTGLPNQQTMFYVKGGAAWAEYEVDTLKLSTGPVSPVYHDFTLSGWTIGGGVEWRFLPNWSAFVEYNHYDFGSKTFFSDTFNVLALDKSKIETVTVGVNYRFWTR